MAIYHLTAKTVSRGSTSSAKARSEYIEREGKYQKDADEVLYKESGNMPEWAETHPRAYWQAADENERANGRLFKQIEFALPKELDERQQKELASSFCRKLSQTKDGPLPYSFAIHKGHDRENPHCHLMISERVNDGQSRTPQTWFKRAGKQPGAGAKKTEELKPKEWLTTTREKWAELANASLDRAGHETRIDHRSLKDQGIEREPTVHLGPAAAAMERKGVSTERGQEYRESQETPEENREKELAQARAMLTRISAGIEQARASFGAWQAQEAEKKRQQELERERERERQARIEAERKAQEQQRREQERAERSRSRGPSMGR